MTFGKFPFFFAFFSFFSKASIEILKVLGLISTKSTSAPQYKAQLAVATKVLADVQTKSPFFTPKEKHAAWSALVALL